MIKITCVFETAVSAKAFIRATKGTERVLYIIYKVKDKNNVFSVTNGKSSRVGYLDDLVEENKIENPMLAFDSDWRDRYIASSLTKVSRNLSGVYTQMGYVNLNYVDNETLLKAKEELTMALKNYTDISKRILNSGDYANIGG